MVALLLYGRRGSRTSRIMKGGYIMAENMETLLNTEDKLEVERITALIKDMDSSEQNKLLIFMQGIKFAENFQTAQKKI